MSDPSNGGEDEEFPMVGGFMRLPLGELLGGLQQQHEHMHMHMEATRLRTDNFFMGLDDEQLSCLYNIFNHCVTAEHSRTISSNIMGRVIQLCLVRGICPQCGVDHDKEALEEAASKESDEQ